MITDLMSRRASEDNDKRLLRALCELFKELKKYYPYDAFLYIFLTNNSAKKPFSEMTAFIATSIENNIGVIIVRR